jgi:hypothetical protein
MSEFVLVWVQGLRGPMPQKWHRDVFAVHPSKLPKLLDQQPLEDFEVDLSLDDLQRRHPLRQAALTAEPNAPSSSPVARKEA